MNQSTHFSYIEEKLQVLARRIESRGKLNILDLHLYSERFFLELCNRLLELELINLNAYKQNVEGIDLVDNKNKVIV